MKHILSLVPDSQIVQITGLAPRWHAAVTHGGFGQVTDPKIDPMYLMTTNKRQIDLVVELEGIDPSAATRFVKAMVVGGENENGARELIRDRHLFTHHSHTAANFSELPSDHFFRNAWRLSSDGKVYEDMDACREIFVDRLVSEKSAYVGVLMRGIERAKILGKRDEKMEALHLALKEIDLHKLSELVARASTPKELMTAWPTNLPRTS